MKRDEFMEAIASKLREAKEQLQDRPHQFVVAYFRLKDESLIGYHLDTFCNITQDVFKAKRYADENPYPQLAIISKNIKYTLDNEHNGIFASAHNAVKEQFEGLKSTDVYMDAIYIDPENMPKQDFKFTIV